MQGTYAVMIIAIATFAGWYLLSPGNPASAIMVGMGKGASNGVVFKGGDAIETLSKVSVAVFDKTGTLTAGKPNVTDVVQLQEMLPAAGGVQASEQVLELAATAEQWSEHPLAKAIVECAKSK